MAMGVNMIAVDLADIIADRRTVPRYNIETMAYGAICSGNNAPIDTTASTRICAAPVFSSQYQ